MPFGRNERSTVLGMWGRTSKRCEGVTRRRKVQPGEADMQGRLSYASRAANYSLKTANGGRRSTRQVCPTGEDMESVCATRADHRVSPSIINIFGLSIFHPLFGALPIAFRDVAARAACASAPMPMPLNLVPYSGAHEPFTPPWALEILPFVASMPVYLDTETPSPLPSYLGQ